MKQAPMSGKIYIEVSRQPDDTTCGPTCLQAVYRFFENARVDDDVISQVQMLEEGGTLASNLGVHALERGYAATIFSFNIQIFDPTWFDLDMIRLAAKLREQAHHKEGDKIARVSESYINFLEEGGAVFFPDLTPSFLRKLLRKGRPIICGLSATFLYKTARANPVTNEFDDVAGLPVGHFVILSDVVGDMITVHDPYFPNPISNTQTFEVTIDHLVNAILLGVMTYDANLLIINQLKRKKVLNKRG